ncbi:MAG: PD-(D/E)XK nuclease family protein [Clostridia bacterium]|nr:PD-(D/E)XK nuclease family protein [Clostridia bacterium]
MNNINIVYGESLKDISACLIKQLEPTKNCISKNHYIIVPDRYSFITENMIFDELNICSTFNINVLGINKLAKQVISMSGLDCLYISAEEAKMLVRRAMQKVKKDFVCFSKNITYGMAEEVYNTISQIKSSNVDTKMLETVMVSDSGLSLKLKDIILIYKQYEQLLGEKMDAPKVLSVFSSLIASKDFFGDSVFLFAGFDSFTAQGYELIKTLAKNYPIYVGAYKPKNASNAHIFDGEVVSRIRQIANEYGVVPTEIEAKSCFCKEKDLLRKNVFAYKKMGKQKNNCYAKVLEANSMATECLWVAKKICQLTKNNGYRFSDISICADSSYYASLESALKKCEISYFDDQSFVLENSCLAKFVLQVLSLCETGIRKEELRSFVASNFLECEKNCVCDALNQILEHDIFGKNSQSLSDILGEQYAYIIEKCVGVAKKSTVENYCEFIEDVLNGCDAKTKIENLTKTFSQSGELFLEKVYVQVYEKLEGIITMLKNYIGDEEISISDFCFLMECGLKSVSIRSIPMGLDCVFVGDANQSFFPNSKVMFVMGANEGVMPAQTTDSGLMSDKDLKDVSGFAKIEPMVKMVNKRNKFKFYDTLFVADDALYITYCTIAKDGKQKLPAIFVQDIISSYENFEFEQNLDCDFSYADINQNIEALCFSCPNTNFANENVYCQNPLNSAIIKQALILKNNLKNVEKIEKNAIKNAKKLFFDKNSTKISQIESYYSCPFSHFLKYGIKLKQQKNAELKADSFGNFLHKFCEVFISENKNNLGNLTDEQVESCSKNITERICETEFCSLNKKENKQLKSLLEKESIRFASFINFEQKHSSFKPTMLEKRFFGKDAIEIFVDDEKYSIIGVVDRIDEYDNNFRIIDYKTGSLGADAATFDSLYYGKKIQIFVYMKAVEKLLNKNCFGVFYLPITNAYIKQEQFRFKMKGFFVEDEALIRNCDDIVSKSNPKSQFIEVELSTAKKSGDFQLAGRTKKYMPKQNLSDMANYAMELVKNAISQINLGNIDLSPFDGACEYCEYKNICKKDVSVITERKKHPDKKINAQSFSSEVSNEN